MVLTSPLVPQTAAVLLLMLVRIGTMLTFMPGFAGRGVPAPVKVAASLLLAVILVPFVPTDDAALSQPGRFAAAVGQEFLVGLLLGFGVAVVFGAIEMAAGMVGMQMGLDLAAAFNPALGTSGTSLGTFYLVAATLVFFAANGHHILLVALERSFQAVPIGGATLGPDAAHAVITLSSMLFVNALRIGLPIAGTLLLVDAALGILNRMVPQMNVFFVGLPLKVFIGFGLLLLTLPFLLRTLEPMVTQGLYESIGRAGAVAR